MTTWVQSSGSCGERSVQVPSGPASALREGTVGGAALDVEHVGEVGADLELEVHADRQRVRVAQASAPPRGCRRASGGAPAGARRPGGAPARRPRPAGRSSLSSTVTRARETVTADNGVGVVALSSSTRPTLTVIRSRLRCRMSSYTRPCVAATMSPASALMAKLRPSTTTRSWRPLVGTLPAQRWCSDIRPLCTTNPLMHVRGKHVRGAGRSSAAPERTMRDRVLNRNRNPGEGSSDEHLVRRAVPGLRPAAEGRSRRPPAVPGLPADLPAADGASLPVR